jgi:hypothetical protein
MLRILLLSFALASCATAPVTPTTTERIRAEVAQERQQDRVRRMQDELNRLNGE